MNFPAIHLPEFLTGITGGGVVGDEHAAWRYTLMSGILPAIPLIIIRPFLPESPAWAKKKAEGTLKRPSLAELFTPELRRTTLVTTAMFAMAYGAAFGAIQHIPRILPGLPEVQAASKAASEKAVIANEGKPEDVVRKAAMGAGKKAEQAIAANTTKVQEVGGLVGRFLLAALAVIIISRRKLLRVFIVPGLFIMPLVFAYCAVTGLLSLQVGIFFAGLVTVGQFSFWGNYLPRVYPVHLRGTGESFAANIGGRLIGTSFAWVTTTLAITPDQSMAPMKLAYTAAAVGLGVYVVGFILTFFLPEPKEELPE
jgi:MFS family permease